LYIRLVEMDRNVLPYLTTEIEKYRAYQNKYNKIIIDIRNNGGGEDSVWISLYSMLINKPIIFEQKMNGYLYSANLIRAEGRKIAENVIMSKDPLLKKYKLYEFSNEKETLEPFSNSINFSGNIFVLADNIYSSAGSCAAITNSSFTDKLISIGRRSNQFLGVGYSPLKFELPNSKFTYRIAPSINSSNSKKLEDLMQDKYQYEIPASIEEFKIQEKNYGQFFSKDYLLKYDPFIKKAMSL
jgi:Peptidase family S41